MVIQVTKKNGGCIVEILEWMGAEEAAVLVGLLGSFLWYWGRIEKRVLFIRRQEKRKQVARTMLRVRA
jgi:hypothetical protein